VAICAQSRPAISESFAQRGTQFETRLNKAALQANRAFVLSF
jgi:hypothetical protein